MGFKFGVLISALLLSSHVTLKHLSFWTSVFISKRKSWIRWYLIHLMALNSVFLLTCETEAFCNFQNMNNFFARKSQVFFCLLLYYYCCIWNNSKPYYCPITKQIPRTCFHAPEHNTVKKPSSLRHLPSVSVSALAALLKILLPWSPELLPTHI